MQSLLKMMKQAKKSGIQAAILLLFLIISVLYIDPRPGRVTPIHRSSQLETIITQNGNVERIDYLDKDGNITFASDTGFASRTLTKTDTGELEEFFDENGERISRYSGYYGIYREFDEYGNNTRITYLDLEGEPVIISEGYAAEAREYNGAKQVVTVKYLDTAGEPILTRSNGYGKLYEYNENRKISKIVFLDENGAPMMTGRGYAILTRVYYNTGGPENGEEESEYYFDAAGRPIALSLGQYGIHMEYDENRQEMILTYLDAEGNPLITKRGYAAIAMTFQDDGSVATERYIDAEGNPIALSEGQYGVSRKDGKTTYLNADGSKRFNLRNLLYNHSRYVILIGILLIAFSVLVRRSWNILLLASYIVVIGYLTLMYRESGSFQDKMELLWSYRTIFLDNSALADILKNIWLFIPLGAFLHRLCPKKTVLLIPLILSILIEGIQYITNTGFCELDDVISNGLGGVIGYGAGRLLQRMKDKI